MTLTTTRLDEVMPLATRLAPEDKLRLMEHLAGSLRDEFLVRSPATNPMLLMAQAADRLGLVADDDDIAANFDQKLHQAAK